MKLENEFAKYAREGNLNEVVKLLENGVDINSKNYQGDSALMLASLEGHIDIVKYLVERGADINLTESQCGEYALYWAIQNNHFNVVKFLLEKGANVNIITNQKSSSLLMAVKNAKKTGDNKIVELLLEKGANVNIVGVNNITPINVAVNSNNFELVKMLLDRGANLSVKNYAGKSLLDIAKRNLSIGIGDERIIKILTEKYSSKNLFKI